MTVSACPLSCSGRRNKDFEKRVGVLGRPELARHPFPLKPLSDLVPDPDEANGAPCEPRRLDLSCTFLILGETRDPLYSLRLSSPTLGGDDRNDSDLRAELRRRLRRKLPESH
jgi:hypothetical protein